MTTVEIRTGLPTGRDPEALVVPWPGDTSLAEAPWTSAIERWWKVKGEKGEPSGWIRVGDEQGPDVFAVRIDPAARPLAESLRRAAGQGVRAARERSLASIGVWLPDGLPAGAWGAAAEGLAIGDWRYDELRDGEGRTKPPATRILLSTGTPPDDAAAAVSRAMTLAEGQTIARELVTQPGNVVTPRQLAAAAERLAEGHGFAIQVWGVEKLREEGFGGLLGVARGSAEEPRFLIMEHTGEGGDPYVVVGKGVTFDAGGISLKPAQGMEDMKYDMAGAAAVVGIMAAAARLGIPQRLIGLVPTTENLPSGTAIKPGDVIRGLSGKSIEVINTDAEGRLILSDALTYAQRLSPRAIVDMATLTGACVVALGHHAVGLMSPSDALAGQLEEAGRATGERVWRLPLWSEYRSQLDSEIADIKNTGGRPASAITAGWFLRDFVDDDVEWAHLDIAGTAWADEARGWQPKGATGVGVRLVLEWLRGRD